jgi:pantetheine-phosphate adenylyltransferase
VVYPGTFDPVTLGHLDVIERGLKLFDEVIIAVTTNPRKKSFFSLDERKKLVQESVKGMNPVKVKTFNGLLVEFCRKENVFTVLRGLREVSDFSFEFQNATINRKLEPKVDSVFVMTNPKYFYLNSGLVKELAKNNAEIEKFVPKAVEMALKMKFKKKN